MHEITKIKELPAKYLFFGYGSLMYLSGINGRGLRHRYVKSNELIPITVKGLRRSMSAEYHYAKTMAVRFYSVYPVKESATFGVLFKIHSLFDLYTLLKNTFSSPVIPSSFNPLYSLYDISTNVPNKYRHGLHVFTLVCEEKEDRPDLYHSGYVKEVYENIPRQWRKRFLKTGGIKPS